MMNCDLCHNPAEYRVCTDVAVTPAYRASNEVQPDDHWLPMNRVYPHRYYCVWHFFLLAGQQQEWAAAQLQRREHEDQLEEARRRSTWLSPVLAEGGDG